MSKEFTMKRFTLAVLTICLVAASAFAQGQHKGVLSEVSPARTAISPVRPLLSKITRLAKSRRFKRVMMALFSIQPLETGTYTVTVTATGFKTFSTTDLKN